MVPSLANLPVELCNELVTYLSLSSFFNFRKACKRTSIANFRYCKYLNFGLTEEDLQTTREFLNAAKSKKRIKGSDVTKTIDMILGREYNNSVYKLSVIEKMTTAYAFSWDYFESDKIPLLLKICIRYHFLNLYDTIEEIVFHSQSRLIKHPLLNTIQYDAKFQNSIIQRRYRPEDKKINRIDDLREDFEKKALILIDILNQTEYCYDFDIITRVEPRRIKRQKN